MSTPMVSVRPPGPRVCFDDGQTDDMSLAHAELVLRYVRRHHPYLFAEAMLRANGLDAVVSKPRGGRKSDGNGQDGGSGD
jgi:hypothetical protein